MSSAMKYKGYVAHIEFSEDDGVLVGRVLGIADHISFHGESVRELKRAFQPLFKSEWVSSGHCLQPG